MNIVGDTDILPVLVQDDGYSTKFTSNVEISRGRVRCDKCKEAIGTEDNDGKVVFFSKGIKKYTVQSVSSEGHKRRRGVGDESEGNGSTYVTFDEFIETRTSILKELSDIKETVLSLFEKFEDRS